MKRFLFLLFHFVFGTPKVITMDTDCLLRGDFLVLGTLRDPERESYWVLDVRPEFVKVLCDSRAARLLMFGFKVCDAAREAWKSVFSR